jgi:hypothetical protein
MSEIVMTKGIKVSVDLLKISNELSNCENETQAEFFNRFFWLI